MKRVSNQQGKLEVFEKFFLGYEFETIDDMMFTERVERFENAIFGISDTETIENQKSNQVTSSYAKNIGQQSSPQSQQKSQP